MPSLTGDNPLPAFLNAKGEVSKRSETTRRKLGVTPIDRLFKAIPKG